MGSVIEWPLTTGTRIFTLYGLVMYVAQNVLLLLDSTCMSITTLEWICETIVPGNQFIIIYNYVICI